MGNREVSDNFRTMVIAGIISIVITIVLATVVVISALRSGQNPPGPSAVIYVTAIATQTPVPPTGTSAPLPTPTSAPTQPAPTVTSVSAPTCQNISGEALTVRLGPGSGYDPPLGALSPQQRALVVGKNAQDVTWWQVQAGELIGWVSAGLCVGDFDPNQVPIIFIMAPTPCSVQVPDLTQRKIDEAEQQARQAQLLPVRDPQCMPEGEPDLGDVVTGQSLAPGLAVGCGSQILLTFIEEGNVCPLTATPAVIVEATPTRAPSVHASSTPQPPLGTPTPAKPAGRLYFPVYDPEKETYHIFSATLDGGDRRLEVAEASQPAVDRTGQRFAYKSWKADDRGSMERPIAGGEIWIFDHYFEAARASFSPDGGTLLFHSREAGDKPAVYRTVFREHEVLRREANPIQGEAPAWVPNGTQFVYKGCLGNDCGILISNLDGGFPRQLTQNLSDSNPTVSPDGQTIAFMSQTDGTTWDIYTMRIDGSGRTQLTADPANDGLPAWSPDGKTLAFVSDRSGPWAMWAMDADGSNQRLLFDLGGSIDGLVAVDVQNSHGWLEETIAWAP